MSKKDRRDIHVDPKSPDFNAQLKALQRLDEEELLSRLRQQKSWLLLNHHQWLACVADDDHAEMLHMWVYETGAMIQHLEDLMNESEEKGKEEKAADTSG